MNSAYVYLQLYKLFDDITPIRVDCGELCGKACCKGEDSGMYLFPGEKKVFDMLSPKWVTIEKSDFSYIADGKKKFVPIAMCSGTCDRYQRPLACRIFPLTPYLDEDGNLSVITDPRAKSVCPLSKVMKKEDYAPEFIKNVERTFRLLMKNKDFAEFMKEYSKHLREFMQFFTEN